MTGFRRHKASSASFSCSSFHQRSSQVSRFPASVTVANKWSVASQKSCWSRRGSGVAGTSCCTPTAAAVQSPWLNMNTAIFTHPPAHMHRNSHVLSLPTANFITLNNFSWYGTLSESRVKLLRPTCSVCVCTLNFEFSLELIQVNWHTRVFPGIMWI